jgi:membrane protein
VPIVKIKIRALIIGALWAAGLWEGMKLIFGYYIANVATFGQIYGTYALIVVVAFWIYYSCVVFVFGAVIGKLYNDNPHRKNYLFRLKPKNESAKKTKTTEIKS